MNAKDRPSSEDWTKPSAFGNVPQQNSPLNNLSFTNFSSQQQQKWEDPSLLDYNMRVDPSFPKFSQPTVNTSFFSGPIDQTKITDQDKVQMDQMRGDGRTQGWDLRTMLNNLSFLEQKIHQLQELVRMIVGQTSQGPGNQDELVIQQQQLITADLTSIIVQLISAAGTLLPSMKSSLTAANPSGLQLDQVLFPSPPTAGAGMMSKNSGGQAQQSVGGVMSVEQTNQIELTSNSATELHCTSTEEEHEAKEDDDGKEEEHLPPGSYEILQLEKEEILAPHTHFCTICGKGFKRDANLRMHMRGHGDEYKTPAALAKPHKESSEQVLLKRYSCPYAGCKRNKDHKKFQPLKTILCVKNHYKRTHCDKSYICSRCHTKKFSVIADLKTHEKHCGRDKWLCSCGTTFSRKDKLFGHIALFQGHTPAIPSEESKGTPGQSHPAENSEITDNAENMGITFDSNAANVNGMQNMMEMKGNLEDPYLALLNYEGSITELQDFPLANFDDSSCSFSFLISGERNGMQPGTNDID